VAALSLGRATHECENHWRKRGPDVVAAALSPDVIDVLRERHGIVTGLKALS
jgi:hypothetical protein